MINRDHKLPLTRQAELLNISRGGIYYKSRDVSAADLDIMLRLDALHLDCPFAESRMLRDMLVREGVSVGRRHVRKLIDWKFLEEELGSVYRDVPGRPPLSTRLMAGLAILKYMHDLRTKPCVNAG